MNASIMDCDWPTFGSDPPLEEILYCYFNFVYLILTLLHMNFKVKWWRHSV